MIDISFEHFQEEMLGLVWRALIQYLVNSITCKLIARNLIARKLIVCRLTVNKLTARNLTASKLTACKLTAIKLSPCKVTEHNLTLCKKSVSPENIEQGVLNKISYAKKISQTVRDSGPENRKYSQSCLT